VICTTSEDTGETPHCSRSRSSSRERTMGAVVVVEILPLGELLSEIDVQVTGIG
jgi:hypothetical protein